MRGVLSLFFFASRGGVRDEGTKKDRKEAIMYKKEGENSVDSHTTVQIFRFLGDYS